MFPLLYAQFSSCIVDYDGGMSHVQCPLVCSRAVLGEGCPRQCRLELGAGEWASLGFVKFAELLEKGEGGGDTIVRISPLPGLKGVLPIP